MGADEEMPDIFYEWLNNCPVQWFRERVEKDSLSYSFIVPNDEEEQD